MYHIGERIRQLRIEKNMTQEDLAILLGYKSRSSVNKFENKRDMPIKKIVPIANALGVTPQYLMGWDELDSVMNSSSLKAAASLFKEDDALLLRLVDAYNQLPDAQKTALVQLAESMAQK